MDLFADLLGFGDEELGELPVRARLWPQSTWYGYESDAESCRLSSGRIVPHHVSTGVMQNTPQ